MLEPIAPQQLQPVDSRRIAYLPAFVVLFSLAVLLGIGVIQSQTRTLDQKNITVLTPGYLVDINHDDVGQLMLLPGIGQTIARRIVKHRKLNGMFVNLEQLTMVSGISHKTLARIRVFLLPVETVGKT